MLFLVEVSPTCLRIADRCKEIIRELLSIARPPFTRRTWKASQNISSDFFGKDECFYVIRSGAVRLSIQGSLFMLFEDNDLLGLDVHQNMSGTVLSSDMALEVDEVSKRSFLPMVLGNQMLSELWVEYLNLQARLFLELSASLLKGEKTFQPEVDQFDEGATIIQQGTTGNDVYTMVEGKADVMVDGVKVGEIGDNQIFGALAAFTNTPRSASIVAKSSCTVVTLKESQFVELMKSRPETVFTLCRDMAKTIVELNTKVVGLEKKVGQL